MNRTDIEASNKFSPLQKLIIEWLSRQPYRAYSSKEVARALGLHPAEVAEANHRMRKNFTMDKQAGVDLALAMLILTPETRLAYSPSQDGISA